MKFFYLPITISRGDSEFYSLGMILPMLKKCSAVSYTVRIVIWEIKLKETRELVFRSQYD